MILISFWHCSSLWTWSCPLFFPAPAPFDAMILHVFLDYGCLENFRCSCHRHKMEQSGAAWHASRGIPFVQRPSCRWSRYVPLRRSEAYCDDKEISWEQSWMLSISTNCLFFRMASYLIKIKNLIVEIKHILNIACHPFLMDEHLVEFQWSISLNQQGVTNKLRRQITWLQK